jgi:hypothetical protein
MREKLHVRLRPTVIKVKLSNGITRTCEFDSAFTAAQVLTQIVSTLVQANAQDYALVLENEATRDKAVLESNTLLTSCDLNEHVCH